MIVSSLNPSKNKWQIERWLNNLNCPPFNVHWARWTLWCILVNTQLNNRRANNEFCTVYTVIWFEYVLHRMRSTIMHTRSTRSYSGSRSKRSEDEKIKIKSIARWNYMWEKEKTNTPWAWASNGDLMHSVRDRNTFSFSGIILYPRYSFYCKLI